MKTDTDGKPLIVAGSCSAESLDQVMESARTLSRFGMVDYFRAGVWKLRTSPGSFQGVGKDALKLLKSARVETGLPVKTEVCLPQHAYEALKYDVDMIWLGARTVSNPFVVQEIAETVRGAEVLVMVKNPLHPDLHVWMGVINRFTQVGITSIAAVHRGFSWWNKSVFRNQPIWRIPLELKKKMPQIQILCDPSHIAGNRSLVPLIARRAVEYDLNGLMVEVHPDPDSALSDSSSSSPRRNLIN